jgi:hypothetical protein
MQSLGATLIWFALLNLFLPASALTDGVPKLDFKKSCREAQAIGGDDKNLAYRGCIQDENDAHEQLARKWTHFKLEDRRDCIAQGASPMPSYVEILTCLEMYDQASTLNNALAAPPRAMGKAVPPPDSPPPPKSPAPADGADAK